LTGASGQSARVAATALDSPFIEQANFSVCQILSARANVVGGTKDSTADFRGGSREALWQVVFGDWM
jgi:hypothetical protein